MLLSQTQSAAALKEGTSDKRNRDIRNRRRIGLVQLIIVARLDNYQYPKCWTCHQKTRETLHLALRPGGWRRESLARKVQTHKSDREAMVNRQTRREKWIQPVAKKELLPLRFAAVAVANNVEKPVRIWAGASAWPSRRSALRGHSQLVRFALLTAASNCAGWRAWKQKESGRINAIAGFSRA